MASIRIENLSRRHGSVQALDDLTLDVPSGAYVVVVGPSGSGKTTLLRLLAGLDRPDSGRVWIGGRERTDAGAPDVAWVPQGGALLPHLDVSRNLALPLELGGGLSPDQRRRRVCEIAGDLGIGHLLDRRPDTLSSGERQRVALGRALASDPGVLLLDEPLGSLDPHLRRQLRVDLRRRHDPRRRTVVHVTHDPDEALALADLLLVLHAGRAEQFDSPSRIYSRPATAFVAGFIGSLPMNLVPGSMHPSGHSFTPTGGSRALGGIPHPAPPPGPVTLGIHPHHLVANPDDTAVDIRLDGREIHREFAGHETLVTFDSAGVLWRVRMPGGNAMAPARLGFRWADCQWFRGPAGRAWTPGNAATG